MEMRSSNPTSSGHPDQALPMPLAAEPFDDLPGALRSEAFAEDLFDDEAYSASSAW